MANFRNGNLVQGQTLGATTTTVALLSNNQLVSPGANQVVFLQSNATDASTRRFNIQSSTIMGQQVTFIFESDSPQTCELLHTPGVGNVRIVMLWSPFKWDALTLTWDGQFWVEVCRSNINAGPGSFNPVISSPHAGDALLYNLTNDDWENVPFSGAITVTQSGVVSLAAGSVSTASIADGAVTSAKIANGTIVAADISASAGIGYSQLAALPSAQVIVGSAGNVATAVNMTGAMVISNAGVTSFGTGSIVNANVSASAAIDYSKLAALPSADILVGSAGNVATAVAMSGAVTITNAGVTSLANGSVTNAKIGAGAILDANINIDAGIAYSKLNALPEAQLIIGSSVNVPTAVDMSGDATISGTGVLTIASGAVTSDKIANATIVAADISASAAIAYSQLASLPGGQIIVGSAGNVPTAVSVTGDVNLAPTGAIVIVPGTVDITRCNANVIASTSVTLTNAQILALDTSSIVLVTGVSGATILIESIQINFTNLGGVGYTTIGGIKFGYATGTSVMVFDPTIIAGAASLYYFGIPGPAYTVDTTGTQSGMNFTSSFQSSFVISSVGALTGGASGNTLTITTTYRTIAL